MVPDVVVSLQAATRHKASRSGDNIRKRIGTS